MPSRSAAVGVAPSRRVGARGVGLWLYPPSPMDESITKQSKRGEGGPGDVERAGAEGGVGGEEGPEGNGEIGGDVISRDVAVVLVLMRLAMERSSRCPFQTLGLGSRGASMGRWRRSWPLWRRCRRLVLLWVIQGEENLCSVGFSLIELDQEVGYGPGFFGGEWGEDWGGGGGGVGRQRSGRRGDGRGEEEVVEEEEGRGRRQPEEGGGGGEGEHHVHITCPPPRVVHGRVRSTC